MTPQALLAALEAAGIRLLRDGDGLVADILPGCSVEPFRAQIHALKSSLMAELLKVEIIAAVNVEQERFDRAVYERLFALWEHYDALGVHEQALVALEPRNGQGSTPPLLGKEHAS